MVVAISLTTIGLMGICFNAGKLWVSEQPITNVKFKEFVKG